ncbi:MAG: lactonase family protein [Lachnospiraceae bacterium]|nr:lactonase family protein [Lachnospiraceae bacterium]
MGEKKYVAYVGTYTHGSSKGINIYDVDVKEGTLTFRKEVQVNNSSYVTKSFNDKYLYSIADEGVEVFKILPDGDLTPINQVDIDGMRGCHMSTDSTGRYLFVAGYHDGKVTVVHTRRDGSLGSVMDGVFHKGTGTVAERTFRPHVCCVRPTPDNKYLCAVDSGIDQVKIYRINEEKDRLDEAEILRFERDSGPRIIRFSKSGKFAYVLCELTNSIEVYSYDGTGKTPKFEKIQEVSTLSDAEDVHDAAEGMRLSPDQRFLFCSTAGDNSVGLFKINPDNGLLEHRFTLPISGEYPKDMGVFPDGEHIAVVNNGSNTITTFTVDYKNNLLIMKGKPQKLETPNSILIMEVPEEE